MGGMLGSVLFRLRAPSTFVGVSQKAGSPLDGCAAQALTRLSGKRDLIVV